MRAIWTAVARAHRGGDDGAGLAEAALMVGLLVTAVAAGLLFVVDFVRGL